MRTILITLVLLYLPTIFSYRDIEKLQGLQEKTDYKKIRDAKKAYYHHYEDWDLDWSNEDMMQHPIDEAPRKVHSIFSSWLRSQ